MASVSEIVDDKAPQSTNVISERESEEPKLKEGIESDGSDSDCSYDDGRYHVPCTDEDIEEFISSPELLDDRLSEEDNEAWRRHLTQCRKSDGFDIDIFPIANRIGGLRPMDLKEDERDMEAVTNSAKYAIQRHNAKKVEKLEFVNVIKAIGGCSNPWSFFITLNARVVATGDIKIYQAHVEGFGKNLFLYIFRPKLSESNL